MELRQLQYLVAVAEEASFTKAAAKAHVAQPGVSAQIGRLERELGQALFDRTGGTVRVTAAGAAVLPYARAALAAVAAVRDTVDALAGLTRGQVALGMVGSIASPGLDLPALLAGFHREHPGVEISVTEDGSGALVEALRTGRLDVALVAVGRRLPPELAVAVVIDEPLVIAVGPDDPLAGRKAVSLDAIRHRTVISLPRGTGLRTQLDEACASLGFAPRIAFEVSDPRMVVQLAERGLGVALVPESVTRAHPTQLRGIPLARPKLRGRLALAWRAHQPAGPAAQAFIEHARRQFTPTLIRSP